MGSSKFFNEGMTGFIDAGNYTYVKRLDVGPSQDSIALGGLFLKAEKDYVDFNAPFIQRGTEEELLLLTGSEELKSSDISIVTFSHELLEQKFHEFTFIESG